jgi:hypothetical protein
MIIWSPCLQLSCITKCGTAIIRSTCDGAADNKMISKWARALRYAAKHKPREVRLKAFMKAAGGINACTAGYARLKSRR